MYNTDNLGSPLIGPHQLQSIRNSVTYNQHLQESKTGFWDMSVNESVRAELILMFSSIIN